jgi:hypothetical protein
MKSAPSSVLIAGEQSDVEARREFERLAERVTAGQLSGMVIVDQPETPAAAASGRSAVRRGANIGARFGLVVGLMTLAVAVIAGAGMGALVGKATQLRIDRGSAPRVHFGNGKRAPEASATR